MSSLKATARASARIRQLAALDISGPQLAPLLLQELHVLLPFEIGIYTHTAADGSYHYFVDEQHGARELKPQSVDSRYAALDNEALLSADEFVFCEFGPNLMAEAMHMSRAEFLHHPFYAEALRLAGGDDGARIQPQQQNSRAAGQILIGRDSSKHHGRLITRTDLQAMTQVQHCLSRALEPHQPTPTLEYDTHETALITIGDDLRLRYLSPNAERLMSLAFGGRWRHRGVIPEELQSMLHSMRQINHAKNSASPPVLDKISPWGRFSFRAHVLDATSENVSEQISGNGRISAYGITVTQDVPLALRLIEAIRKTSLPLRQSEICYWLARGSSQQEIADRCGISINTAIYHRRQIYAQFNASNRNELAASLLASSKTRQ